MNREERRIYLFRSILENTYVQCVSLASVSVSTTPLGTTSSSPKHSSTFNTNINTVHIKTPLQETISFCSLWRVRVQKKKEKKPGLQITICIPKYFLLCIDKKRCFNNRGIYCPCKGAVGLGNLFLNMKHMNSQKIFP